MSFVQKCKNLTGKVAGVVGLAVTTAAVTAPAHAIDVTAAVTSIDEAGTAMATVGAAILLLAGISLAYRWVKATFF